MTAPQELSCISFYVYLSLRIDVRAARVVCPWTYPGTTPNAKSPLARTSGWLSQGELRLALESAGAPLTSREVRPAGNMYLLFREVGCLLDCNRWFVASLDCPWCCRRSWCSRSCCQCFLCPWCKTCVYRNFGAVWLYRDPPSVLNQGFAFVLKCIECSKRQRWTLINVPVLIR